MLTAKLTKTTALSRQVNTAIFMMSDWRGYEAVSLFFMLYLFVKYRSDQDKTRGREIDNRRDKKLCCWTPGGRHSPVVKVKQLGEIRWHNRYTPLFIWMNDVQCELVQIHKF